MKGKMEQNGGKNLFFFFFFKPQLFPKCAPALILNSAGHLKENFSTYFYKVSTYKNKTHTQASARPRWLFYSLHDVRMKSDPADLPLSRVL